MTREEAYNQFQTGAPLSKRVADKEAFNAGWAAAFEAIKTIVLATPDKPKKVGGGTKVCEQCHRVDCACNEGPDPFSAKGY